MIIPVNNDWHIWICVLWQTEFWCDFVNVNPLLNLHIWLYWCYTAFEEIKWSGICCAGWSIHIWHNFWMLIDEKYCIWRIEEETTFYDVWDIRQITFKKLDLPMWLIIYTKMIIVHVYVTKMDYCQASPKSLDRVNDR